MLFGLQCEVIIYIFAADKKQTDDTMKIRVVKSVMMLSVALLLAGCDLIDPFNNNNNDSGKHRVITPVVFTVEEEAVADASNDFAFRFFRAVDSTMPKGANYVISPYSAQVALSMAMNGAADSTFMQMHDVLGYSGMGIEEINSYNKKLIEGLDFVTADARVKFANSLWINNNQQVPYEVLPEFSLSLLENYNAKAEAVDFKSPDVLKYINRWCSSQTNSLIDNAVKELNPRSVVMLLNAVCFNAPWSIPFEKKNNFKDYFYSDAGKRMVTFMKEGKVSGVNRSRYIGREKFEAVTKSYGGEGKYNLCVVMPREGITMEECLTGLTAETFIDMMKPGKRAAVLSIPKFEVENSGSVIPALESMGMIEAFTERADFSNLVVGLRPEAPIYITDMTQGNLFSINEKGTEAASVTKVEIGTVGSSGVSTEPVEFTVNRPFLFFVMENSTKTVLFAGKVSSIE